MTTIPGFTLWNYFVNSVKPNESIRIFLGANNSIPIKVVDNVQYISLDELSNKTSIEYDYYESKNKYEIQLDNNKLIITPNSTFILFNDDLFNGLYPAFETENDVLIPVTDIITLLNNNGLYIMFISTDDKYVLTNLKSYNVDGLAIENKVNGTQIKISTNKYFPKKNISASVTVPTKVSSYTLVNSLQIDIIRFPQ